MTAPARAEASRPPALLLVNRAARRARTSGLVDRVVSALRAGFTLDVRHPDGVATMRDEAAAAAGRGIVVFAAGGDGTVSLVADAVRASRGTLGIIPLGTANDLARELGLPADPVAAAELATRAAARPADLVAMNGRGFGTVGGLGLVSASTTRVARLRASRLSPLARLAGAGIYRAAATASLLAPEITSGVRVRWSDASTGLEKDVALRVHGLFVTNHARCGGGLVIPTGARGDDGVFELALVPETSRPRLLLHFARLSAGLPLADDALVILRARRAVVETERDDTFVADGESLGTGRTFALDALPAAISILR